MSPYLCDLFVISVLQFISLYLWLIMTSFDRTIYSTHLDLTLCKLSLVKHFTSLHFTSLHFTSLHFTSLYFTSLHFTSLQFNSLYSTMLHIHSLSNYRISPFSNLLSLYADVQHFYPWSALVELHYSVHLQCLS